MRHAVGSLASRWVICCSWPKPLPLLQLLAYFLRHVCERPADGYCRGSLSAPAFFPVTPWASRCRAGGRFDGISTHPRVPEDR